MPQLDFIIIFPQIFWLIFFFILFYFVLTYFFLPLFLQTVLSRTKLIKQNILLEIQLTKEFLKKRQLFLKKLNHSFSKIHFALFNNVLSLQFSFFVKPFKHNYMKLNKKIFNVSEKSLYFCNFKILKSFNFYPSILNKKN